jgi:hypothetical protein
LRTTNNKIQYYIIYCGKHYLKLMNCLVLVAHTYNPSYWGVWNWDERGLRSAQANRLWDPPHLHNNQTKVDWRRVSSGPGPASWVQSPEFKLQSYQWKAPNKQKTYEVFIFENFLWMFLYCAWLWVTELQDHKAADVGK